MHSYCLSEKVRNYRTIGLLALVISDGCFMFYIHPVLNRLPPSRKSSSWHTSLRIRKKSEKKEREGKKEVKLENGYRKSKDGLANKVSVKVSGSSDWLYNISPVSDWPLLLLLTFLFIAFFFTATKS